MNATESFEPKWATPPGATVLDVLREREMAVGEFAEAVHRDLESVSRLLHGVEPLTDEWAEALARVVGASPTFWLRREALYRSDLKRVCEAAGTSTSDWAKSLPLGDMVQFGWIERGSSPGETALNACAFLGVVTANSFERRYKELLSSAAYRASNAFVAQPSAVAAWLRQGEIVASAVDCASWNETKLREAIEPIRALTNEEDPQKFLPPLRKYLAGCGIALVVARAPAGCHASGVARFLNEQKGLIQLSFRYLSDDQFWFTLFHEIGHILLHAKDGLFIEMDDHRKSAKESEADAFAISELFANVGVESLDTLEISKFAIARLARKAGIAPGLIVGQLQARKRIPYKHFNYFKKRYAWQG
jgi:HTH-type transcriptional regulator / antitoxin HigA